MGKALALADWLRAHSERAWALIGSGCEGKVADMNPLQVRVGTALVQVLASAIDQMRPFS
jgi:hypothetical protein